MHQHSPICQFANSPICNTRQFTNSLIANLQILQQSFTNLAKSIAILPPQTPKAPQGRKIFAQIACNFAKIKCKVCKIATFVAIVRYKIALYNANDFVQIVQIVCTNFCKIAN